MNIAIKRAIERAGSQSALARACATRQGTVWAWLNGRRRVPLESCPTIERTTGVLCEALRPDVQWQRDDAGNVTGYTVPLDPVKPIERVG